MNVSKRDEFIKSIDVSLHTLMVKAENADIYVLQDSEKVGNRVKINADCTVTMIINPNKGLAGNTMIKAWSLYRDVLADLFDQAFVKNPWLVRVDLAVNSYGAGDFDYFKKLYKLLISCISTYRGTDDPYETYKSIKQKQLNTALRTNRIDAENYDKEIESHGSVPTTNRFEIRSKNLKPSDCKDIYQSIVEEFTIYWQEILKGSTEKAIFGATQKRYNDALIDIWKEDREKNPKYIDFANVTGFLLANKNNIFTYQQLVDLLEQVPEVTNVPAFINFFRNKYRLEMFSHKDLRLVTKEIYKKIKKYFEI